MNEQLTGPMSPPIIPALGDVIQRHEASIAAAVVDHTVRKHHKNSPSKIPYLAKCAGYTNDDSGDKSAAEAGTRLHEIMDEILKKWVKYRRAVPAPVPTMLAVMDEYLKERSDDPVDDTDRSLLVFCIRAIEPYLLKAKQIINEIRVNVTHPSGRLLTSGHLDVLLIFANGSALVVDYKFGWVPVDSAKENRQGLAYALGALEAYPEISRIGVTFIQPKLNHTDSYVFEREQATSVINDITDILDRAVYVQERGFTEETAKFLQAGDHCGYCVHSSKGTCPARLAVLAKVARVHAPELPLPPSFILIDTPSKAAQARHWVETVEDFLDGVKSAAKEYALNNGGRISYEAPDGTEVVYAIEERNHDRTLGSASEIAEALSDFMGPQEVIACCEPKLGLLEKSASNAIFEATNNPEQAELAAVELMGLTPKDAKKKVAEIKERYADMRITKKDAKERFQSLLESRGLLSRPDGKIPVLKRQKSSKKELTQKT